MKRALRMRVPITSTKVSQLKTIEAKRRLAKWG